MAGHLLITRRQALMASGVLALTACAPPAAPAPSPTPFTVDDLLAGSPFYIAHRGSMDNWPEHTAEAYTQAAAAGAPALEVSVSATADGQIVCHHDLTTGRMTGKDLAIATTPYEELRQLQNDARKWLGPKSLLLPIPLLRDVLDEHAAARVIFIEDKQGTNTDALLRLLEEYPDPTKHVIWKQSGTSDQHVVAGERGYRTWGYFDPEDEGYFASPDFTERAQGFDLLGVQSTRPDKTIRRVVALGKPVVSWEVHSRSARDRLVKLGVRGMMCSNIPYVTTSEARSTTDVFATGVRGFGDLPWALAWTHQPTLRPETSSLLLDHEDKASYSMGSMCPIGRTDYTLTFDMRWPDSLPRGEDHAGIAFGQDDDSPYRIREVAAVGGYHLVMRRNGEMELFGRVSGQESGYSLGHTVTPPPVVGEWMRFAVHVTPTTIQCERKDANGASFTASSDVYRGGYFSLTRNYYDYPPVEFRAISVA